MTRINHLAIVVQDLEKSVQLFSKGFGLRAEDVKEYPAMGMKVAILKADNIDLELIEPTGPGLYWQFRSSAGASFNHVAFEGDSLPSFDENARELRIKPRKNGTRPTETGTITDLDPDTTLGLRLQVLRRRA